MEQAALPPALLAVRTIDGQSRVVADGAWTAANGARIEALIAGIRDATTPAPALTVDARAISAFDTYGAWLLVHLARTWESAGGKVQLLGLPDRFATLYDTVRRAEPGLKPPLGPDRGVAAWLASIGRTTSEAGHDLIGFVNMLGLAGAALLQAVRRPATFRLTSTVHQLDRVAWQAVPIILLITFLIGCIIAQQGFFHFRKFGADSYVVDMVGILVTREIGVLLVAIMVAGRSGSSYTAELGSMKMREEIDAIRTMGLDPIGVLVLPRLLALVIALPVLTLLGSLSALYGGGLVAWFYGDMNPDIYIARLREAISLDHFKVGIIKAPFMALVIGIVACSEGLQVKGSAESLGLRTTASVVKSIFLVIVIDGLFAMYFAAIGM